MAAEGFSQDLVQAVGLLGAGVIAVPIFRKLKLGSVLGYLPEASCIGPSGIGLFDDPERAARRRTRRRHVPLHHRAGDGAGQALGPARRDLRARRLPGRAAAACC
jgi:hypothetical protein